jgi:hypothetical protein
VPSGMPPTGLPFGERLRGRVPEGELCVGVKLGESPKLGLGEMVVGVVGVVVGGGFRGCFVPPRMGPSDGLWVGGR